MMPNFLFMKIKNILFDIMIASNKFFIILSVFSLLGFSSLIAQTYDDCLWTGVSTDLPITKRIDLSLEHETRLAQGMEIVDWHISDIGLSYKFNKDFRISSSYNYRSVKDKWQHVFNGNFHYDNKFWKIRYSYRFRYQEKHKYKFEWNNEGIKRIENGYESYFRNRIMFEYDTDMWLTPFIGFELYYLIGHYDYPQKIKVQGPDKIYINRYSDRFNCLRLYLGTDIEITKNQKLTIYYMSEHEFNISEPKTSNVLGLFYHFDLPKLF